MSRRRTWSYSAKNSSLFVIEDLCVKNRVPLEFHHRLDRGRVAYDVCPALQHMHVARAQYPWTVLDTQIFVSTLKEGAMVLFQPHEDLEALGVMSWTVALCNVSAFEFRPVLTFVRERVAIPAGSCMFQIKIV